LAELGQVSLRYGAANRCEPSASPPPRDGTQR
jgi:hypothetical protein